MPSPLMRYLNVGLGALVIAIGAWMATNALSVLVGVATWIAAAAFLWWRGRTITLIWAWSTL
ncbi:MAG TPA: hypothetical protein VH701_07540, partial [Vicinamibacterales bacterium]